MDGHGIQSEAGFCTDMESFWMSSVMVGHEIESEAELPF